MAVLSIILTAPTGAILINTLGVKWLSDDTIYQVEEKPSDQTIVDTERALKPANKEISDNSNGFYSPKKLK